MLADVDGALRWYSVCRSDPLTGKRAKSLWEYGINSSSASWGRCWHSHGPNTLNGVTPVLPFTVFVERPGGYFSPFGMTPHLHYLNITLYAPTERVDIGHETWMAGVSGALQTRQQRGAWVCCSIDDLNQSGIISCGSRRHLVSNGRTFSRCIV